MRRLLEIGVYFTLTVTTSTKQKRRVIEFASRKLIYYALMQSLDVVHSSISMSSSSSRSTMPTSLSSLMPESSKKLNKLRDFTLWSVSLVFEAIVGGGVY